MDLLKYLEPMKNLPERFSNLAFWRDVRKLKDDVVNAFEYVDSWGENIEHTLSNLPKLPPFGYYDIQQLVSVAITDIFWTKALMTTVGDSTLISFNGPLELTLEKAPNVPPTIQIGTTPQFSMSVGYMFWHNDTKHVVIYFSPTIVHMSSTDLQGKPVWCNYF